MRIDTSLDQKIASEIKAENEKQIASRVRSGKLSASILHWPLQWQVLKYLRVPSKPIDDYVLRKFLRGRHVEEWLVSKMGEVKTQTAVEYKDCIGYVDVITTNGMVHEIKSVTNAKYRRIMKDNQADESHRLQGCLYALGLNKQEYTIDYVSTDDYRVTSFVYEVDEIKVKVDTIIKEYNEALVKRQVPLFIPRYKWQENSEYNSFPQFSTSSMNDLINILNHHKVEWPK